jgi:hypothetical protein
VEINPFLDADGRDTGRYVNPPDASYEQVRFPHDTYKPVKRVAKQIVWSYQSKASASSSLDVGVQPFEFSSGVADFELPVDAALLGIGFVRPSANFCLQGVHLADPPVP